MPPPSGGSVTRKYTRLVQEALHTNRSHAAEQDVKEGASVSREVLEDMAEEGPKEDVSFLGDEDTIHDDDDDDDDTEDDEENARGSSSSANRLFSCDVCPHLLFASQEDLLAHAQEHHQSIFPDYAALYKIAIQLAPHWTSLKSRKEDAIRVWGAKIFHVAATRDAGEGKMREAHRAREQLELVVRRWRPGAKVYMFGSAVSFAVWDGMSDVDFAVVDVDALEAGTWPPPERNAVRSITELLRRVGFSFANIEPISHARVPIIKHHASAPIRLVERPVTWRPPPRRRRSAHENEASSTDKRNMCTQDEDAETAAETKSVLEAEHVVARSVRFLLSQPATPVDRVLLEGSVREAVERPCCASSSVTTAAAEEGPSSLGAVQQVWWNRTADVMSVTCDSTTSAMKAATAMLYTSSAALRTKVQALHDECRPELFNVDFDLSFRAFGIRNSLLLRRYLTSHPCARPGAIVLKDWSKTSGVNNSVNGYLTSYAVNIMWIYFLVHRGVIPYVDPIKDIPATLRAQPGVEQDPYLRDGFPAYIPFVSPALCTTATLRDEAPQQGPTEREGENEKSGEAALDALHAEAGELLLDFFYFYAFEFNWDKHVVSLNRSGVTTKKSLGWDVEDIAAATSPTRSAAPGSGRRSHAITRYEFCIEDPYEVNLNLGRHMGITKVLKVKTELYRAFLSLLKDGASQSCVFAATDAAEAHKAKPPALSTLALNKGTPTSSAARDKETREVLNAGQPDRLSLRVLYRLTATALHALAAHTEKREREPFRTPAARQREVDGLSRGGIPSKRLESVLRRRHPAELALALKVWNWQQLVHRLGLKEMHGTVYARREVGARRLAAPTNTPAPMSGASTASAATVNLDSVAAPHADATVSSPTDHAAQQTVSVLRTVSTRGLAEQLILALTTPGGYLALTPSWVAWSTPWATLKTRFTPTDGEAMGSAAGTTSTAGMFAPTRPDAMPARGLVRETRSLTSVMDRSCLRLALKKIYRK